jgi:hypothetical protein
MKAAQLALDFDRPAEESHEERLAELLAILIEHGGWLTRRDLEARGFAERELRELAEHDADAALFSYPGSPGYKHFDHVTDAEFDRCGALRSQAGRMLRRHMRYQRRWHRRGK